jgi:alpha-mannosidase
VFTNIQVEGISSLVESSKSNIVIDSIKKAEDSDNIIIRMHETQGVSIDTTLRLGINALIAMECDLLETDLKQHKIIKSKLQLKFRPFEIKTIKLAPRTLNKRR